MTSTNLPSLRLPLSLLAFLCFAPLPAAVTMEPPTADRRAALDAADHALGTAWQGRDLEQLLAYYAEDAVEVWTGFGALDRDGLRSFWTRRWSDAAFRIVSGERDRYVVAESGDLAYMRGTSSYRYTLEARQVIETGEWFSIWQWREGAWKIVYGGFNRVALVDAPGT